MDAYVFAENATLNAVQSLIDAVADGGVRVVCPLGGDRELYVAVSAADEGTMNDRAATVVQTEGITGASVHVVLGGNGNGQLGLPTHVAVSDHIGFAMLTPAPGQASATAAAAGAISGVVGVAVVTGSKVLVEVTATSADGVQSALAAVTALVGVTTVFTARGATADGAGFQAS